MIEEMTKYQQLQALRLAVIAFNTYNASSGLVGTPRFADLPDKLQKSWIEVAIAIRQQSMSKLEQPEPNADLFN